MQRQIERLTVTLFLLLAAAACNKPAPAPAAGGGVAPMPPSPAPSPGAQAPGAASPLGGAAGATATQPAAPSPSSSAAVPTGDIAAQSPEEVVRRATAFYKNAESVQVDYTLVIAGFGNQEITSDFSFAAQRPNRFSLRQRKGVVGLDLISDGDQLYAYMPAVQQYMEQQAPASFTEMLKVPVVMTGGGGPPIPLLLFSEDPYQNLMEEMVSSTYVGQDMLGDTETHHLKFAREQFDWELWVAAGDKPLVIQSSLQGNQALQGQGQVPGMSVSIVQKFSNWQFDTQPAADAFAFTAPPGATKIDNPFGGLAGIQQNQEESSPLTGKPAPDFALKLLDGQDFSLASQQGQNIVMLDFWATWCGPCVQEMPILAELAAEYRDKGVALFAVNLQEDAETVREFLEANDLDVTVALDSDGAVATAYGAAAIPMLVLIDLQGVVSSVHVGYNPQIKQTLKAELDALLASGAGDETESDAPQDEATPIPK